MALVQHSADLAERYRLIARLGEGGMAEVYAAVTQGPHDFQKVVVAKLLRGELEADEEFVTMFLDEARLASRLSHPNVVSTHEVGVIQGRHAIVMEYLDGFSLSQLLRASRKKQSGLSLEMGLGVLCEALTGLHYIHEYEDLSGRKLEIVHRDFTPANIVVTFNGMVKVLDLGIAKAVGNRHRTRTGAVKGTVRFLSPEVVQGRDVESRTDLYSAGVVLWELLTQERLFKDETEVQVIGRLTRGDIPSIDDAAPDAPTVLRDLCRSAMANELEDRPASADAFRRVLLAYLEEEAKTSPGRQLRGVVDTMEDWFGNARKERKALLAKGLKSPDLEDVTKTFVGFDQDGEATSSGRRPRPKNTEPPTSSTVALRRDPLSGAPERPEERSRRRFAMRWALGAVTVLAAGGVGVHLAAKQRDPAPATTSSVSAPPVAPQPEPREREHGETAPPEEMVQLSLRAEPREARLRLDGEPLAGNPVELEVPRDDAEHRLEASAEGFQTRTERFRANANQTITIPLAPEARPRSRRARVRRAASPMESVTAEGTTANAAAEPPSMQEQRDSTMIIRDISWN